MPGKALSGELSCTLTYLAEIILAAPILYSLVYNREEDEIYAGGVGFLEEWRITGAEVRIFYIGQVNCKMSKHWDM